MPWRALTATTARRAAISAIPFGMMLAVWGIWQSADDGRLRRQAADIVIHDRAIRLDLATGPMLQDIRQGCAKRLGDFKYDLVQKCYEATLFGEDREILDSAHATIRAKYVATAALSVLFLGALFGAGVWFCLGACVPWARSYWYWLVRDRSV